LEAWVFDPQPLTESPWCSICKSVHLNHPDNKQISGFGLPPIVKTGLKYERSHCLKIIFGLLSSSLPLNGVNKAMIFPISNQLFRVSAMKS